LRLAAAGPVEDLFQKLSDLHFHLILLGQPPLPANTLDFGDLLRIHAIPADPANAAELARTRVPASSF
jgi:hypothetical protein